jgi:transcription factor SPN1
MSDEEDDDLFADSDDTAELIAASKSSTAPAAKKKKSTPPDSKPDADGADSSDDGGLFDSDSESEEEEVTTKKKKPAASPQQPKKPTLSKKERLEALASRRQRKDAEKPKEEEAGRKKPPKEGGEKDDAGYDSGDTYDSGEFQRTAEDDAFIDTTGEDADAVNELYAEQHFGDDERPEPGQKKKKKKRKIRPDEAEEARPGQDDAEPDNPIMAAVHRMKKKKREKKTFTEMEEEVKQFLTRMDVAAEEDEIAIAERRPATKKLAMLNEVLEMLTRRDMQRMLLDYDLLTVCKRWVQPLRNGALGNVTVRQKLLESIGNMTGDTGITATDLKRSEFGKVVMVLYKHRSETPAMKRQLKTLIEQWSRPIFQKSGNMRDLDRVQRGGEGGLAHISRQQQQAAARAAQIKADRDRRNGQDLNSLIASGRKGTGESAGRSRVSVPFSKGFAYSVRPSGRTEPSDAAGPAAAAAAGKAGGASEGRDKLKRRMLEKGRAVGKNQRSANISIEGRATKG